MRTKFYRICPTQTFTLNNRWYTPVFPKKSVFFIPYKSEKDIDTYKHIDLWINFLKRTHNKRILYLYLVDVEYSTCKKRVLEIWKGEPLWEIIIDVKHLGHRHLIRRRRV